VAGIELLNVRNWVFTLDCSICIMVNMVNMVNILNAVVVESHRVMLIKKIY
jgi:hypothetical protein